VRRQFSGIRPVLQLTPLASNFGFIPAKLSDSATHMKITITKSAEKNTQKTQLYFELNAILHFNFENQFYL
jgi:hypothetical protein